MILKIRCDGEYEKFYKILWKLNKALFYTEEYQPLGVCGVRRQGTRAIAQQRQRSARLAAVDELASMPGPRATSQERDHLQASVAVTLPPHLSAIFFDRLKDTTSFVLGIAIS